MRQCQHSSSVWLLGCGLVIFTLTRLVLLFQIDQTTLPFLTTCGVFLVGFWFDVATLAYIAIPVFLFELLWPSKWARSAIKVWATRTFFSVGIFLLLFNAIAEQVFWLEFRTRFNFIAVDYLLYTHEVIGNIMESYPIFWIIGGLATLAILITWGLSRCWDQESLSLRSRIRRVGIVLLAPVLSYACAHYEQMQHFHNAYAQELSGNGLFTLFAAARHNELDYDRFYLTQDKKVIEQTFARLGLKRQHGWGKEDLSPLSVPLPAMFKKRPRNIVLISVESLSADFLGIFGNPHGLTPNLDRLSLEGIYFTRLFATGTRTVRGLEALSIGTPPIPGQSIVRRFHAEHLATIGELLEHQGVIPIFIYGGHGYFDNMNAFFSNNDYQIIDRSDIPKERIVFENIWGVADEVLYEHALVAFEGYAREQKPFFAHMMTTSNHRPYTYPDGRIDIPSPGGRSGAVKYTDYAIGKFIQDAKTKPWFDETLFVIVADHCASVAGKTKLPVAKYQIPLILYGPSIVRPMKITSLKSQIDIAPSLINLMGKRGASQFFGTSLFDETRDGRAFISNYEELGYYKNNQLVVLSPKKKMESFKIDPTTFEATPASVDSKLLEEAVAYYQTASEDFKRGRLKSPDYIEKKPPTLLN